MGGPRCLPDILHPPPRHALPPLTHLRRQYLPAGSNQTHWYWKLSQSVRQEEEGGGEGGGRWSSSKQRAISREEEFSLDIPQFGILTFQPVSLLRLSISDEVCGENKLHVLILCMEACLGQFVRYKASIFLCGWRHPPQLHVTSCGSTCTRPGSEAPPLHVGASGRSRGGWEEAEIRPFVLSRPPGAPGRLQEVLRCLQRRVSGQMFSSQRKLSRPHFGLKHVEQSLVLKLKDMEDMKMFNVSDFNELYS